MGNQACCLGRTFDLKNKKAGFCESLPRRDSAKEVRLLDEYCLGHKLGEGAFGVVSTCTKRSTGEVFAVKMIDKVESPLENIKREAKMLQALNHINIVKVHGVFFEKCFVCIVMDKYAGGDVVDALQRHLKDSGSLSCHSTVHVARQMGASICYLHDNNVMHRDIKGDNFIMDRRDMTDPECIICLTDFGTACKCTAQERQTAGVGTELFWSPEVYDKNYGLKADVWAMGVTMYGLVSGRFAFRSESDVRRKEVKVPRRVDPVCVKYIMTMLAKTETDRASSQMVMTHQWVTVASTTGKAVDKASVEKVQSSWEGETEILRERGANVGVKDRREELVDRMEQDAEAKRCSILHGRSVSPKDIQALLPASTKLRDADFFKCKEFTLTTTFFQGSPVVYGWWSPTQLQEHKILDVEKEAQPLQPQENDNMVFSRMLEEHNIETSCFGEGKMKTVHQLASEVRSGAARLMLDATEHKKLVRVVDLVLLRVHFETESENGQKGKDRVLLETHEQFPDGRDRITNRLPGTKKEPHENTKQVAWRILENSLNIDIASVDIDLMQIDRHEEETESPSYPGVRTVYRKEIVEVRFIMSDPTKLAQIGLPDFKPWKHSDSSGSTKTFHWCTEVEMEAKKVQLKSDGDPVATLVHAPLGLTDEALIAQLSTHKIDVSKWQEGGIDSLAAELARGETSLVEDPSGGLTRVVDMVVLILKNASGEVLVENSHIHADGQKTLKNRLPGIKRRPDENHFIGVRRLIRKQLCMDENQVIVDKAVTFIDQQSDSSRYPGLKTTYRKRLVKAHV